jgi:hypothetical protein
MKPMSPALPFVVLGLATSGCGARVLVDGAGGDTGGGGAGGTITTTTTTTETPCFCATNADCPTGTACADCQCIFCAEGFADCDGIEANGCEAAAGTCICSPGEVSSCYDGPAGTEGFGVCKAGLAACAGGTAWGPCEGQLVPSAETCDGLDGDCDGHDDTWDPDGDGWTACDGDCCETTACAPASEQVNPGAMEYPGNGVDDDCNPATPDGAPFPDCGGPALQAPTSALDLVEAMDLCVFTSETPPSPKEKTWGVISAALTLADGSTEVAPADVQAGVLADYGQAVVPEHGTTMAAISSGTARDEGDPGFVHPQNGYAGGQFGNFVAGTQSPVPADFLAANFDQVPSGCYVCKDLCAMAFDSVALKLRIRTPTNTDALQLRANFFSAEYPESVCTEFNDFFVALLDSQHPEIPADKNIAHASLSVNTALFASCAYPSCSLGSAELAGTGMGGWDGTLVDGGATSWTVVDAPIVPGETIELRLVIWDATDGNVDSLVLLDRFRFRVIGQAPPPSP